MTTVEYALIAGLAMATLVGVGLPLGRSLTATFGEIAGALDPGPACGGAFCVEPAAGERRTPQRLPGGEAVSRRAVARP